MWLWILIGLSIITKVHGFSNGEFTQSCQTMLPEHNPTGGSDFPPQTSVPPFDIEFGEVIYGAPLTVNLKSRGSPFKGFMLEARKKNMVDWPVGRFFLLDTRGTRLLPCTSTGGQSYEAVTQTTNSRKNSIQVNWTAEGEVDTITFRATFLQSFSRFWRPVEKDVTLPTTPPPPTSTQSTTTSTTVTTTTNPSSTTSTAMTSTTNPSSTTSTTVPTTTETKTTSPPPPPHPTNIKASTTTSIAMTSTTNPSSTSTTMTSTTNPSSTTSTTMTSTTNPSSTTSTTVPTTTETKTTSPPPPPRPKNTKASTTTSYTVPSATSTAKSSQVTNLSQNTKAGILLMTIDIFNTVKTEHYFIVTAIATNNAFSRCQIKISNILFCVLCAAFEISSLVLFCKDDPTEVTLVVLVCVVLVINIVELVIYHLPIEASHELKDICDHTARACSVIHMIFSYAVIFVGVLKIEDSRKHRKESWLVIVVIAYAVCILVSVVRTFILSIYGDRILETNKIGTSERCRRQEELNAVQKCIIAVSEILLLGALLFTVAVIVGVNG